jgi:arylsulfatase A-like enzyme
VSHVELQGSPVGYRPLTFDLYLPPAPVRPPATGFPLVIQIHGGAFMGGDKRLILPFVDWPGVQAINWVKAQQSMTPDKPFFVYFATGATHAPHHVPKEWADKYKGQYDKGWDQVRAETLERQKKLGVIPANTQLAERAPCETAPTAASAVKPSVSFCGAV